MLQDPLMTGGSVPTPDVAQTALYRERRTTMLRLGFLLTGSTSIADELFHDAFEQVVRRWDVIEFPGAYLRLAVVNGARSWGRRQHIGRVDPPAGVAALDAEAIAVRDALGDLRQEEREVIVLRYYLGLTDVEIAESVGRPVGTVKSQIFRGLARMKEALT